MAWAPQKNSTDQKSSPEVKEEDRICFMWGRKIKDCDGKTGHGDLECGLKDDKANCPKFRMNGGK